MENPRRTLARHTALAGYGLLLAVIVLWEAWLAPPTPVSRWFWLTLKVVPLLLALPGLYRGSPRTYVLAALLVLLYFSDAVADIYHAVKTGAAEEFAAALLQLLASLLVIAAAPIYARLTWRDPAALAKTES